MHKPRILVFIDWFHPGFRAGGPIRSIANFASELQSELDIYIVTSDRDVNEQYPYASVTANLWSTIENYNVFYASPSYLNTRRIKHLISQVSPDWIYLNGMFSWKFSILPVLVSFFSRRNTSILLAPRGMLKESALQFKRGKKLFFLKLFKSLNFQKRIIFQATSNAEKSEITEIFGTRSKAIVLSNLPAIQKDFVPVTDKTPGSVSLIYIARIHPLKNLHLLLEALSALTYSIDLTVVGKVDDLIYWNKCTKLIEKERQRDNFSLSLYHEIPNERIRDLILRHHLFVLPTQGENFGHAIFESLAAGRPVLTTDQTPWNHLERVNAGWNVSLENPQELESGIVKVALMDVKELNIWAYSAWRYGMHFINDHNRKQDYINFFRKNEWPAEFS